LDVIFSGTGTVPAQTHELFKRLSNIKTVFCQFSTGCKRLGSILQNDLLQVKQR
jgi:hypothetical protein